MDGAPFGNCSPGGGCRRLEITDNGVLKALRLSITQEMADNGVRMALRLSVSRSLARNYQQWRSGASVVETPDRSPTSVLPWMIGGGSLTLLLACADRDRRDQQETSVAGGMDVVERGPLSHCVLHSSVVESSCQPIPRACC